MQRLLVIVVLLVIGSLGHVMKDGMARARDALMGECGIPAVANEVALARRRGIVGPVHCCPPFRIPFPGPGLAESNGGRHP